MIPAIRSRRTLALGLALSLVVVLGWWWTSAGADEAAVPTERSMVIQRQPFAATLAFAGKVAPGEAVSITVPFDGTVRAIDFAYGAHIAAGACGRGSWPPRSS